MHKKSFIGVDLHTNCFTSCYLKRKGQKKYENYELTFEGLENFFSTLNKNDELAVEATANSSFFIKKLKGKVKTITLVAPAQFSIIGKSTKKTDLEDSYKLAFFLSKNMLPKARHKPEIYVQLLSFVDTRACLIRAKTALLRKTHAILVRNGYKVLKNKLATKSGFERHVYSKSWSRHARKELDIIYFQIQSIKENSLLFDEQIEALAKTLYGYENLLSIKGMGPLSVATVLAVIGNIDDFYSPKNLSSYFGLVPRVHQSNETLKLGHITKSGNNTGREALVQCAWVAIKFNPHLKKFFSRIKKRSCSQVAIVACARRLFVIVYYTLKNDWVFDDFTKYKHHVRNKEDS